MKDERKTKQQLIDELKEMRKREEDVRIMLESIGEGVTVTDLDLNYIDLNQAMLRLIGRSSKEEVIGHNAFEFVPPSEHASVMENMRKTLEEGYGGEIECTLANHSTGENYYAAVAPALFRDKSGKPAGYISITKDITGRKRAEEALLRRNKELAALNAIAETVSQSLELNDILNRALDKTLEILDIKNGTIAFLDKKEESLTLRSTRGLSEEQIKMLSPIKMDEDVIGQVASFGEPLFIDSLVGSADLMRRHSLSIIVEQQLKSGMWVPLNARGQVLGVLAAFTQGDRVFTSQERDILITIGHQISAAVENAMLYQELQRKEEIRGEVLRQAIKAQEEERRRIARELHDQTSQVLAYASAKTEAAIVGLPPNTDEVKARLNEVQISLNGMFDDIHRIIYELRPTVLDDLGLVAAVRWHIEESLKRAGVKARFETAGRKKRLSTRMETAIFRIIQEATTNIVRHAGAENVSLRLAFRKDSVVVKIEDDGEGFNLKKATSPRTRKHGLGLLSMKERAELMGGVFSIETKPGSGTRTTIEIPID
ncbi:MAG: PAS domain S-box protein [Chloroflexi bacterium]|jgi:PAS domain S-box-containing protein|nr:PAS domain S-box protein [Chloroflexota bacterium]